MLFFNFSPLPPPHQGPHSKILMTGRSDRGSYFIPKKITTSELSTQKNHYIFLAYPQKYLCFFRDPKKSRCHRPKKITFGLNSDPKNHSDPLSLKYVSGAPGLLPFHSVHLPHRPHGYTTTEHSSFL